VAFSLAGASENWNWPNSKLPVVRDYFGTIFPFTVPLAPLILMQFTLSPAVHTTFGSTAGAKHGNRECASAFASDRLVQPLVV